MSAIIDIDRLVDDLGVATSTTSHHSRPGWVQMCCPFCEDETFHLGYERKSGRLSCYRCGGIKVRAWLEAVGDGRSARELLQEYRMIHLTTPEPTLTTARKGIYRLPPASGPLKTRHRKYLHSRGFPETIAFQWGLVGTTHLGGKWQWRIIAPVRVNRRYVTYQGRDITGRQSRVRWLSPDPEHEEVPIKETLYGLHLATRTRPLLVVEGPADVWRMGPGAVATYGVSVTQAQRRLLRRHRAGLVIAFDPDVHARQRARRLADALADHVPVTILEEDDYEDLAAMPQCEADKLKKEIWP